MNRVMRTSPYCGSGRIRRLAMTRRRGINVPLLLRPFRAVLRTALLAIVHAMSIERTPNDVGGNTPKNLHPTAPDEHGVVLLQVVPLTRNVGSDFHPVGEPHARDLPESRVRLLRSRRIHAS